MPKVFRMELLIVFLMIFCWIYCACSCSLNENCVLLCGLAYSLFLPPFFCSRKPYLRKQRMAMPFEAFGSGFLLPKSDCILHAKKWNQYNTSDIADTLSGCRGVPFVVLTCMNYSRLGVLGEKLIEIKTCCIDKNIKLYIYIIVDILYVFKTIARKVEEKKRISYSTTIHLHLHRLYTLHSPPFNTICCWQRKGRKSAVKETP